jgi:hypothetical protein
MTSKAKAIYVVYANWCPHCVPTTVGPMKKAGEQLGVPVHLYDIDTNDVGKADAIVKKYGDWSPDYIIPQVFVELDGGEIKHVLTGYSEGVAFTRKAVENLLKSDLLSPSASKLTTN